MSYHYYLAHIRTLFYLKSFFSHVITKPNYWHFTNNETQILIAAKNIILPILKVDSILSSTVLNKKIAAPYLNNHLIIF